MIKTKKLPGYMFLHILFVYILYMYIYTHMTIQNVRPHFDLNAFINEMNL